MATDLLRRAAPDKAAYRLRPATEADFPAIRWLVYAVRINPVGLKWANFVIAEDDSGRLIGCGQIKTHDDGSRELASIAVVSEWRSRGVAGAIIRRLLAENPGRLFLTCRNELGPFYNRFGFRIADKAELSPYFLWLSRLAWWLQRMRLAPRQGLLIMVNDGNAPRQ